MNASRLRKVKRKRGGAFELPAEDLSANASSAENFSAQTFNLFAPFLQPFYP